jgi:hypothetical protein
MNEKTKYAYSLFDDESQIALGVKIKTNDAIKNELP